MVIHFDDNVRAEERLWCLILALVPSRRGMSKQEIFDNVRGYREEFAQTGATDALNKKFERDKDELKSMGIPLLTSETENPADAMYSIPEEEYEKLSFSESEVTLLAAAGAIWRDSAHSNDAREARVKLLANDVPSDPTLVDFAPRMNTFETSYGPVAEALTSGHDISFAYLKPGDIKPEVRRVSPLALLNFDSRWHLLAFDHGREAERTFLLRRIVGKVHPTGPATVLPSLRQTNEFASHLSGLWNSLTATIRVAPLSKAAVTLANRQGTVVDHDMYTVHYLDEAVFADELCEYGAEAIVIEPASLRAAVIARLERLAVDHG